MGLLPADVLLLFQGDFDNSRRTVRTGGFPAESPSQMGTRRLRGDEVDI